MQTTIAKSDIVIDEIRLGLFTARRIEDTLNWGQGAIRPQSAFLGADDQRALVETVLSCLEPVNEQERAYSACTDGRCPVRLLSGEAVPVREQMVGADIVSAFYAAETLGERFYKDANAPLPARVTEVAHFLQENGVVPSTHVGCGAAAGFAAIIANAGAFGADPAFLMRLQALLPEGVYDQDLCQVMLKGNQERLKRDAYKDLTAEVFIQAVETVSGKRAIAELNDDGRGVHGHVEEVIMRVRVPGYAINEAKVAELTGGREVFGVNDGRMERLARLFGRGQDTDYRTVYMALEIFADTGHGTLAKDLPTYIITSI